MERVSLFFFLSSATSLQSVLEISSEAGHAFLTFQQVRFPGIEGIDKTRHHVLGVLEVLLGQFTDDVRELITVLLTLDQVIGRANHGLLS